MLAAAVLPAGAMETVTFNQVEVRKWGTGAAEVITTYPHPNIRLIWTRVGAATSVEAQALHRDQLGSVRAVTTFKPLTGEPVGNRRVEAAIYRPFGEQTETLRPTQVNQEQKGWIGQRYDADAGLQYLNARYYDPEYGFFLQPDWFEVKAAGVGTNRYGYAGNDPINFSDPGGNCPICIVAVILYFTSTDPGNAPGPDDQMLPANGDAQMVTAAVTMVGGRAIGGVVAGMAEEEAEEELSTLERNALVGGLAEKDVVADFEAQGVTVTPRVSISDGNVRCVSDCVITGAPGQQLEVPSGFVAEDISGTKLAGNNGGALTTITLNSEGRAIIEVKTGGATLTGNQSAGYSAAQSGSAEGVGGNAAIGKISGSFGVTPVYVLRR